ncbi:MAG TPA: prolyl oligopeptidase family serine peptidase [Pyrinomonadaceae bacterium]
MIVLIFAFLSTAVAAQPQSSLQDTLEKEGCATLETSKVRICKYDYIADKNRVEALIIRPLAEGKYPGIVLLAGREGAATMITFATIVAQRGFACVAISELGFGKSEGKPDFMGPPSIDAYAVGFKRFRSEPFVDRTRIAVYGYSRGGMAASLLTLKLGTDVKAAVFAAGIYDFRKAYDDTGLDGIRENMKAETGMSDKAVKERSSILKMEKLKTEVLIIHGANDQNAPTNQAVMLRDRLSQLGKDFEFLIVSDHRHGQLKSNFVAPVLDFLSRKLKAVPDPKYR